MLTLLKSPSVTVQPGGSARGRIFVNKQWFNMYYILAYKKVTINFSGSKHQKAILNNIMNLVYQPGNWVKTITFGDLDTTPDQLLHLMNKCPNVQQVKFNFTSVSEAQLYWTKFEQALLQSDWQLKCLPAISDVHGKKMNRNSQWSYMSCAFYSGDTLTDLSIPGNILKLHPPHTSTAGSAYLEPFKKLETLQITDDSLVYDFEEFCELVQHIHVQAVKVIVDFPINKHYQQIDNQHVQLDQDLWTKGYSRIQQLDMTHYAPRSAKEIQLFMDKFQHLKSLTIIGFYSGTRWLESNKIGHYILVSFFELLFTLPKFKISIPADMHEEKELLQIYYKGCQNQPHRQHNNNSNSSNETTNSSLKLTIDFTTFSIGNVPYSLDHPSKIKIHNNKSG